ncbi:Zinc finger and SCAN domain-containing protein 12 [Orchesella cincta]|uniref:Zinc finger and SCAN domain-containing protein 12 n=1 Tax=Orchesella cincta TaxID=48709 RepID=A0A1D2NCI9_ORCCI|nr:Zinc finger and SCAN domain-containing protein 12 [Orchesella cincta]
MGSVEVDRILTQLGLTQYIDVFKENQITDICLDSLEKTDLVELVPAVGHRARIWTAMSKLKSGSVYVCFQCSERFTRLKDLSNHLTSKHRLTGNSEYSCTLCQGLFNRKGYLQHMRNSFLLHKQLEVNTPEETELPDLFNSDKDFTQYEPDLSEPNNEYEQPQEFELKDVERNVMKLMCSIMKSGKVPISTADTIILTVKRLMQEFDTKYKLDKYLIENELVVMPKQIVLDSDISFNSKKGKGQRQSYKAVSMQYIPIKTTLHQLLNIPGYFQILEMSRSFNGEFYSNFREGKLFQRRKFPQNTIFINIYYDDAEIANPLGSKSGKHKLANFYFSVLDLPQHMLSSPDNVLLLASLKTVDMKSSSVNEVLKIVVKELKELWSDGITFKHNGNSLNFKVALAQVTGDNLGLHTMLGFSEGFTANYPCRRCKLHKNECKTAVSERHDMLRNVMNYDRDIISKNFPTTGINFESIFNELPYLHVTDNYVFDLMHDILEGIAPDLFYLAINDFVKRKYFSIDKLNFRLESFDYGRGFRTTKPSQIKASFLKGDSKIGQNASQTLCLVINFSLIFGDLVPKHDQVWKMILLLKEITLLLLSDYLTYGGIVYLNSIISEFLSQYQIIFNKPLKPKHHHLTHYGSAIEEIGPLRHFWSMTYEAKHKFFKTAAHAACNFKNVAKTLAYRHQLSLGFKLQSIEKFTPMTIEYVDKIPTKIDESIYYDALIERFGEQSIESLRCTSRMFCNGCEFDIGCMVVLEYCSMFPTFETTETKILDIHDIVYHQSVYPESQLSDEVSFFDGSIISEQEMADRGIVFESSVLQKLKRAKNQKPEPFVISEPLIVNDKLTMLKTPPQPKHRYDSLRNSSRLSSPAELIPLPTENYEAYNYKFQAVHNGVGNVGENETGLTVQTDISSPFQEESRSLSETPNPALTTFLGDAEYKGVSGSVILDPSNIHQETCHLVSLDHAVSKPADEILTNVGKGNSTNRIHEDDYRKSIYGFDLVEILQNNSETRLIVTKKVDENRFILRSDRQAIAAALIDAVIENLGTSPSKNALEQLAQHLVSKYPVFGDPRRQELGWQMWFFHTVKGHGATGFLEDRLKNQRKKLAKKREKHVPDTREVDNLNWDSENDDYNPPPDDCKLEFMKHNFGPEVTETMKDTVFMRRSLLRGYIKEQFLGLQKAMQSMPRLFDMDKMLIQDFNIRHPSVKLILYERWPKVSKLLLEYAEESGICYKKKLDISKHRYDLDDADVGLVAFCLLPFILPSCARKANQIDCESENEDEHVTSVMGKRTRQPVGSRKRQSTVKASDMDSMRSMIMFRSKNTHVSEVLSQNKRIAPFILGLGSSSNLEFDNYFVVIHKVAIPCGPNFFVALDTCFKSFSVLYLPPPIESFDHWLFIQHGVCGQPAKDTELPPVVQALIAFTALEAVPLRPLPVCLKIASRMTMFSSVSSSENWSSTFCLVNNAVEATSLEDYNHQVVTALQRETAKCWSFGRLNPSGIKNTMELFNGNFRWISKICLCKKYKQRRNSARFAFMKNEGLILPQMAA